MGAHLQDSRGETADPSRYPSFTAQEDIEALGFEAQPLGEHYLGKRVQVPAPGALSRDDVMGSILAYDAKWACYTVALDNGTTKYGVRGDEIRVRKPKPRSG